MQENNDDKEKNLTRLPAKHDTFIALDSDGCVFDTMTVKQIKCIAPTIISHWNLGSVRKTVISTVESVSLFSETRGQNRFLLLITLMNLLKTNGKIIQSGTKIPSFNSLKKWVSSGVALSNESLKREVQKTGNAELKSVLNWSLKVNRRIAHVVKNAKPFKWAKKSLPLIASSSDIMVVSQTPVEALTREWKKSGLTKHLLAIGGQELGAKSEQIRLATRGKYRKNRILMIGDAPGDMKAAKKSGVLFYPINPGHEEESWKRFHNEAYKKFISGTYSGKYSSRLKREFMKLLPSLPKKRHL